jgi:hypothetical protein
MQHDADRGILLPGRMVPALDASGRAGKDDLGHGTFEPRKIVGALT